MAFSAQQTKRMQVAILIVAGVVVAVLAIAVFSGALVPASSSTTAQDGAAAQQDQGSASGTTSSEAHDMTHVDANYEGTVEQLQAQYDADPSNPSALLQLANGYFDWGAAALQVAETDEDNAHVVDLFNQAIARYDDYLADNPDSKSVEVDRAICIFYTGDTDRAIATLEDFVAAVAATCAGTPVPEAPAGPFGTVGHFRTMTCETLRVMDEARRQGGIVFPADGE